MLIDKNTQEIIRLSNQSQKIVFVDKNTGRTVQVRAVVKPTYYADYFDHSEWLKFFLLGLTIAAVIGAAIVSTLVGISDANKSWIDEINRQCVMDDEQVCVPININGIN